MIVFEQLWHLMGEVKEKITSAQWKVTGNAEMDFQQLILQIQQQIEVLATYDRYTAQRYSNSLLEIQSRFKSQQVTLAPSLHPSTFTHPDRPGQSMHENVHSEKNGLSQLTRPDSTCIGSQSPQRLSNIKCDITPYVSLEPRFFANEKQVYSISRGHECDIQKPIKNQSQTKNTDVVQKVYPQNRTRGGSQPQIMIFQSHPDREIFSQVKSRKVRKRSDEPLQTCLACQATETPEWRQGPAGPRTLCNACGLLHAKRRHNDIAKTSRNMSAPKFSDHSGLVLLDHNKRNQPDFINSTISPKSRRLSL